MPHHACALGLATLLLLPGLAVSVPCVHGTRGTRTEAWQGTDTPVGVSLGYDEAALGIETLPRGVEVPA
ncbi:MAG: hypothetical protein LC624_08155 [Halobacteriales archaeon]|nr:hypothetical protein [Halobacteriales archaeon]